MLDTEKERIFNGSVDIIKIVMAVLVIGIHTEPFAFNIWLDRLFGLATRICVPFFFVSSAYFYWIRDCGKPLGYIKRIITLYIVWSLIYLPKDWPVLSKQSLSEILYRYAWKGNEHALWFLCSCLIGFFICYGLQKCLKPKYILVLSFIVLCIGCLQSSWAPVVTKIYGVDPTNYLGTRNGLFYGFPYMAIGMYFAKDQHKGKTNNLRLTFLYVVLSFMALVIESIVLVLGYGTKSTILWVSVFPYTFYFFLLVNSYYIPIKKSTSKILREYSTLMYVSQFLFIHILSTRLNNVLLFLSVTVAAFFFAHIVIHISRIKYFKWLQYLY